MKSELAKSGRHSSFPQLDPQLAMSSSRPLEFRVQALEQDNRGFKGEIGGLEEGIRGLKQDNREMKEENRGLLQLIHQMNSTLARVSLPLQYR